ncbi:MAG: hypothetical protein WDN26_05150 [Chitinophagaceae bacterium]
MIVYRTNSAWLFLGIAHDQLIAQEGDRGLLLFKNNDWTTLIEKISLLKNLT